MLSEREKKSADELPHAHRFQYTPICLQRQGAWSRAGSARSPAAPFAHMITTGKRLYKALR